MAPFFRHLPVDPRTLLDLCDSIGIQPSFGPGEMRRLLFTRRPSDLQLNRRQRLRELLRLSRLTDEHSGAELRDPTSAAHRELIDIAQPLAR